MPRPVHNKAETEPRTDEGQVLTKAVIRAAAFLDIPGSQLAKILGVSESSVSRMKAGEFVIQRDTKQFEIALTFVRLFRSLDAITGSDDRSSRSWMHNENRDLRGRPIDLIVTIRGLFATADYVDAHRAIV